MTGLIISLLSCGIVFVITSPFTNLINKFFKTTGEQMMFSLGLTVITFLVGNSISYRFEYPRIIKRALKKLLELKSNEELARLVLFILTRCPDVEFKCRISVEKWIFFLTAGADLARKGWFSTYLISLQDWPQFGELATQYNKILSEKNIEKHRCIIQPFSQIDQNDICNSALVKDSRDCGINLPVIDKDKIDNPERLEKLEDFALFDDEYVIVGKTNKGNLTRTTKVNIQILKGTVKVSPYIQCKNTLLRDTPDLTC